MRIREALLVLVGMMMVAAGLALWRFDEGAVSASARPFVVQLNWRAQAESGGFVMAVTKGYYRACGLDVVLRQGGSGIDPRQLLVSGAVDAAVIPQIDGIMHMNEAGFPARAVFASLQHTPASLIVHADSPIRSVAAMRGRPISISASTRAGWWPYLRTRYRFTDDQIRPFNGQRSSFIHDRDGIVQDVISNGPYVLWRQARLAVRSFRIADLGFDPYDGVLTVPRRLIDRHPAAVRCLVQGSQRGWSDFMRDPRPAFATILRITPEMSPGLLAFAFAVMRDRHLVETPETARLGVGAMTEVRWRRHANLLGEAGLLPRDVDVRPLFTNRFLKAP